MHPYFLAGAGAVAVGLAGFLFKAASAKPEFHLERSVTTSAGAGQVYAIFSDFDRYRDWSPWQHIDPAMKTEMTGPAGQVGTSYRWEGNNKVGAGVMTITEAVPNSHVQLRLEFLRPMAATNTVVWKVVDEGAQRRVTWSMEGRNDTLFRRAFALLFNMDKMVGKDFEKGLDLLKSASEAGES